MIQNNSLARTSSQKVRDQRVTLFRLEFTVKNMETRQPNYFSGVLGFDNFQGLTEIS